MPITNCYALNIILLKSESKKCVAFYICTFKNSLKQAQKSFKKILGNINNNILSSTIF